MQISSIDTDYSMIEDYLLGKSYEGYKFFGAIKDNDKYIFRVYAPNADNVYIRGDFSNWENLRMTKNHRYGYFFIRIKANKYDCYKYLIEKNGVFTEKSDPYAKMMDLRPEFATWIVEDDYKFKDSLWMDKRSDNLDKPLNIYELHLGSWVNRDGFGSPLNIVDSLVSYLKKMNYTHVELTPITEYPLDESWGYQVTGFFSMTRRYGNPNDLKEFIDILHQNNIGVILDYVIVHYANDNYGLKHFDGNSLYEPDYPDIEKSQWGSFNFDYSKNHVKSFIKSSINYWITNFHFDGIRMDAISNMIYWDGNSDRGVNENNLSFLKELNHDLKNKYPSIMLIAEDSSSYPKVTSKVEDGGVGFDYKWDLGWMNDTLRYFSMDSFYRSNHQSKINFSMFYFYNEKYILPISHDEVVHLKKSMINKMSGSYEDKFKQYKLFYIYQMTHPGKKLNFMGNEIAMFREWDEHRGIDWNLLEYPIHDSFNRFVADINKLYISNEALYKWDFDQKGFLWNTVDDNYNSVFSYFRIYEDKELFVVLNMTNTYKGSYEFEFDKDIKLKRIVSSLYEKYGGYRKEESTVIESKDKKLQIEISEYEAIIYEVLSDK